ncbi:amino acid adenylation domain-containing protein [Streptosporangiaceae bacterium NEAU-GS5]|nr:amino acid adenylation domain-containing protein [Streptosporangiaceae bacterium NEAU-GS5]
MNEWEFPASYGQERLWLASRLQPDSPAYNLVVPLQLPPGVGAGVAAEALAEVVRRHEALRTCFRVGPDGLRQVVRQDIPIKVPVADLSGLPKEHVEAPFEELCRADGLIPFALDRAPLWRARLIQTARNHTWLVIVAHHTICDGASVGILRAELTELCAAAAERRLARLPELPIQYADWTVWQRDKQLTPERLRLEVAYWRTRLAGIPAVHSVPMDRPRPAAQSYAGGESRFKIYPELADRLAGLARRLRVTPFSVMLAAYAALLARLGGQPDVVVGIPVAGRDTEQVAPLIGMFVNTLPVRVDTSADPSFEELVAQVAGATAEALDHSAVPLQHLVDELAPRRDLAVPPLYQLGFNHPEAVQTSAYGTSRDELCMVVHGREGRLEYRSDLFDARTADTIVARYLRVLDEAARRPGTRVSRLSLMDAEERALVLNRWNGVEPPLPDGVTVPALILEQATRRPEAVAVDAPGGSLTYAELVRRAGVLAAMLREQGAGPERLVAIALPRSADLIVAMLATLLSGAAYVPLDLALPADRLAFMLADSGAAVVLTTAVHRGRLPETDAPVLDVAAVSATGGASQARSSARPSDLAYVIYTSGSTGRPKGVEIEHRSLSNYVRWFVRRFGLDSGDRSLAQTSPGFDASGIELWPVLASGGAIVIATESAGLRPDAVLTVAAEHGVTLIATVPTVLRLFVDSPVLSRCTTLRRVVCGGEQLSGDLARRFAERLPVPLHNLYGPTEATIDVTVQTCYPTDHFTGPVPIGRPIANTTLYVLDSHMEPVPPGVSGHLHIGGLQVARGYLGRPDLTAERFVPDPFGPPGSRLYRTGDLAHWTPRGALVFEGRIDAQIKIRGLRIEPGEIEAALTAQPGVRAAAVLVREDVPGDERLVAYVVGEVADTATLRAELRRSLPDYMVPAAVVALPDFPATSNGKLDTEALPAPDYGAARGRAYVAPRTDAEELVADVWAQVLGVERVGADDDFFDLGGHSLLAAQIAVRLSDALGVDVPIHLFFSHVSVAALAQAVEDLAAGEIDRLSDDEVERQLAAQGGEG